MQLDHVQLANAARKLRIHVPRQDIVKEILQLEGTMLVRSVEEALKGNARATEYLRSILLACHETTADRLAKGRMSPLSLPALLAIGKAEGSSFALRVKEWAEAGFPDGDTARYIRLTIARNLEAERRNESTAAQPPAAGGRPAPVSTANFRPHRGNTPAPASRQPAPQATTPPPQEPAMRDEAPYPTGQDLDEPPPWVDGNLDDEPLQQPHHGSQDQRAQAPRPEQDAAGQERGERGEAFLNQHIYGGKAAACFSADVTRAGVQTVRMEAAEASAQRSYNWKDKISIQLSQRELPLVLGVFMGWLPRFEGKGHGEANSKWFTLENQGNKLYLSINAKGKSPRGVPIMPGDGYSVTTLLMRQMLKNDPFLSPEILLSLVRKEVNLAQGEAVQPAARRAA